MPFPPEVTYLMDPAYYVRVEYEFGVEVYPLILGALEELADPANWEDVPGEYTKEEIAAAFIDWVDEFRAAMTFIYNP
jgi:hypothetical protein